MEVKIKLPGGGYIRLKQEPMERERFNVICVLVGIFIVGSGFIKFFALLV